MSDEVQTTREQREAVIVALVGDHDPKLRYPAWQRWIDTGDEEPRDPTNRYDGPPPRAVRLAALLATREAVAAAAGAAVTDERLVDTLLDDAWANLPNGAVDGHARTALLSRLASLRELVAASPEMVGDLRAEVAKWRKLAEENQGAAILHDEIGRAVGATGGESVLLVAERVMRERAEARELARVLEVDLTLARRQLADARRQIVLDADRRALSRTISRAIRPSFAEITLTFNGDIVSGSLEQPDGGDGLPATSAHSAPSAPADAGAAGDEALVEALLRRLASLQAEVADAATRQAVAYVGCDGCTIFGACGLHSPPPSGDRHHAVAAARGAAQGREDR